MMDKITVFFQDGRVMTYDRNKVAFRTSRGALFDFCDDEHTLVGLKKYHELVRDGRTLVNWSNVCFVREQAKQEEDL